MFYLIFSATEKIDSKYWFAFVPTVICYSGFGYQMFYFLISNQHLIIKNHFFPWLTKYYNLDDIIEIHFEQPWGYRSRRSKSLRVITKDFKTKLYSAGSLQEKHWRMLQQKFESYGIEVKDIS